MSIGISILLLELLISKGALFLEKQKYKIQLDDVICVVLGAFLLWMMSY